MLGLEIKQEVEFATLACSLPKNDERQDYLKASSGGNNSHLVNLLDGTVARKLPASAAGQQMQYDSYFYTDSGGDIAINTEDGGRFAMTAPFPIASYQENQLILAEAKAKTGNDAGALTNLNNFRADLVTQYSATAADFPASTASGAALLNQILEEKYNFLLLENDYLTTPERLIGLKEKIFKDKFFPINPNDIKKIDTNE